MIARYSLPIVYLILLSISGFSQVEWEELPAHNAESVELLYVSQEDHFIGRIESPERYVISKDKGETWDTFIEFDSINVKVDPFWLKPLMKQDNNGDYHFYIDDNIYRYNESAKNLEIIVPNIGSSVNAFYFLPNGNIVLNSDHRIALYSSDGILLNEHFFQNSDFKILIGDADVHYIILDKSSSDNDCELISFNSDLTEFSDPEPFIHFYNTFNAEFEYQNEIFYSRSAYSFDGLNWIPYENGIYGELFIGSGATLYLFKNDFYYRSIDSGLSFVQLDYPSYRSRSYRIDYFPLSNGGLVITDPYCSKKQIFYTGDDHLEWTSIADNLEIGNPFAEEVEVGVGNNIFIKECGEFDLYSNEEIPNWQKFEYDSVDIRLNPSSRLVGLPNSFLINKYGCLSFNQGKDWECLSSSSQSGIIVKNGVLYSGGGVRRSFDFGLTWESIHQSLPSTSDQTSLTIFGLTQSGTLYYEFCELDILGLGSSHCEPYIVTIDGNRNWLDPWEYYSGMVLASSYNGSDVYTIKSAGGNIAFGHVSNGNQYFDFKEIDFPYDRDQSIMVDHLENVYIYSHDMILISRDRGQTWIDITPVYPDLTSINDIEVGYDNHIYVATSGTPILKSKTPLGLVGNLKVEVYEDLNGNCTYDNNENGISGIKVELGDGATILPTNSEGEASTVLPQGSYDVQAILRDDLYVSCDNNQEVIFDDNNTEDIISIPVTIKEVCADVGVGVTIPFLRRCFNNTINFDIYNDGSAEAIDVIVHVTLDDYFEYISSDQELISVDGQVYSFNIGTVASGDQKRGFIEFNLSCDAEIGQAHYLSTEIHYNNPCEILLENNMSFECQENIGSFDPNDKTSIINGFTNKALVQKEESVEYKIRFQNTGTDTAFTIRIEDPLVSYFDINSVEPIAASHDYTWSIEKSTLIVIFDDIQLVDSFRNEKDSHGFVKFKITLDEDSIEPGDLIANRALIYFDYNEPIITNTVENHYICKHVNNSIDITICPDESYEGYTVAGTYVDEFVTTLGCDSTRLVDLIILEPDDPVCLVSSVDNGDLDGSIIVYPNPSNDIFYIESDNQILKEIEVYDVNGHRLNAVDIVNKNQISLKDYPVGLYFIKIRLDDGSYVYSKIIKQ